MCVWVHVSVLNGSCMLTAKKVLWWKWKIWADYSDTRRHPHPDPPSIGPFPLPTPQYPVAPHYIYVFFFPPTRHCHNSNPHFSTFNLSSPFPPSKAAPCSALCDTYVCGESYFFEGSGDGLWGCIFVGGWKGLRIVKWGVWQSAEDTIACWHMLWCPHPPPCSSIQNISSVVLHHEQGLEGWEVAESVSVYETVCGCVW